MRPDQSLVVDGLAVHLDDRLHLDNGAVLDEGRVSPSPPQNRLGRLADAAQHENVRRVARGRDRARERGGVVYSGDLRDSNWVHNSLTEASFTQPRASIWELLYALYTVEG